jgi:hypothetical protein
LLTMAQPKTDSIAHPLLRWARGLLLLVHVAGCGSRTGVERDAPIPSVDLGPKMHQAGTRLVPLAWISDSGPTIYTRRFYDRQRDENCAFAQADDGSLRCFPLGLSVNVADESSSRMYVDDGCKEIAIPLSYLRLGEMLEFPSSLDLRYFALENEGGCDNALRMYEAQPSRTDALYAHSMLGCQRSSSTSTYLASGVRVANEQFAAGVASAAARREPRLGLQQITSTDGAAAIVGWHHLEDGIACAPIRINQAETRCVATLLDFRDLPNASCNGLVAVALPCAPPRYGLLQGILNVAVHEVVSFAEVDQPSPALLECASAASDDATRVYALMDEVPREHFPLVKSRDVVERRIKRVRGEWVGPEGDIVLPVFENFPRDLLDLDVQLRCDLMPAADGRMRCLPNGGWQEYYADAACSERLLSGDSDGSSFAYYTLGTPGEPHPVVTPGEVHVGEIFERNWGLVNGVAGGCLSVTGQLNARTWYRIAAEVPPGRFVQYELRQMQ